MQKARLSNTAGIMVIKDFEDEWVVVVETQNDTVVFGSWFSEEAALDFAGDLKEHQVAAQYYANNNGQIV